MPEIDKILEARQKDYGNATENFAKIGKVWGALLNIDPIEPYQVALMMDALKTVRLFNNGFHEDSWIDKHGYIHHARESLKQ